MPYGKKNMTGNLVSLVISMIPKLNGLSESHFHIPSTEIPNE